MNQTLKVFVAFGLGIVVAIVGMHIRQSVLTRRITKQNVVEQRPPVAFKPALIGRIYPAPGVDKGKFQILIDGQDKSASVDELGRFRLETNLKEGERIRVLVFRGNTQVYDDYQVLVSQYPVILAWK